MEKAVKNSVQLAAHYKWGDQCDGWHLLQSDRLSVISERMPPDTSEQAHYHSKAQQLFYILSGTATFEIENELTTVQANESFHIPAGIIHRIANNTADDLHFLVISEPRSHGDRIEIA